MILVILEVNGLWHVHEAQTVEMCERVAESWLATAKKHYPNKVFIPRYFSVTPVSAAS